MAKATFLLLAFIFIAAQALYTNNSPVQVLTDKNFQQVKKGKWLVQFYADWCHHCKSFAKAYEEAAIALKGVVDVAAIDAFRYKTFVKISGYPQVKLFLDGKIVDYYGRRDVKSIGRFVQKELKRLQNEDDSDQ